MTNRFEYITKEAASQDECKNRCEFGWFHAWNPKGALQQFTDAADRIDQAISEGRCKGGAYLAYGHGNSYHYEQLMYFVRKGRAAKVWSLQYHVKGLIEAATKADEFLASL